MRKAGTVAALLVREKPLPRSGFSARKWFPAALCGPLQFPFSEIIPEKNLKQVEPCTKKEDNDKCMNLVGLWYFFDICLTFSAKTANISQ